MFLPFSLSFDALGESLLIQEADSQPPHKMDENMWKNREHIEEILFLLERPHWPSVVRNIKFSYLLPPLVLDMHILFILYFFFIFKFLEIDFYERFLIVIIILLLIYNHTPASSASAVING